jgi:heterodisulfide reductase subunit C2
MATRVEPDFHKEIKQRGGFNATACMNCGVCTALCPMNLVPLPRRLFRQTLLGMTTQILEEEDTIFSCLLCRLCEAHCPAGVPIAENIRLLRGWVIEHQYGLGR